MSAKQLRDRVRGIVLFFLFYVSVGIALVVKPDAFPANAFELYRAVIPIVVAGPAAYLAFAFQRRNSYLQALRDLWKQLIPAVQGAIAFTRLEAPTETEKARTLTDLSVAIDALRGVFRNVSDGSSTGLYPFENLKDIHLTILWLIKEQRDGRGRQKARRVIVRLWQHMHSALLLEFDRDEPLLPVSKYIDDTESLYDKLSAETLTDADFDLWQKNGVHALAGKVDERSKSIVTRLLERVGKRDVVPKPSDETVSASSERTDKANTATAARLGG